LLAADPIAGKEGLARLRQRFVAAHVVGVRPGVDDVANRFRRDPPDGGDDRGSVQSRPGVHDHDAIAAHLHADVAAGAGDQEDVGANLDDLEAARQGWTRGRASDLRRSQQLDTAIDEGERGARRHGGSDGGTASTVG
jgi:hypothetical protein